MEITIIDKKNNHGPVKKKENQFKKGVNNIKNNDILEKNKNKNNFEPTVKEKIKKEKEINNNSIDTFIGEEKINNKSETFKTGEKKEENNIGKQPLNEEMNKFELKKEEFEKDKEKFNNLYKNYLFDIIQNHDNFSREKAIFFEKLNIDLEEINDSLKISIKDLNIPEDISILINEQNNIYKKLRSNLDNISNNISNFKNIYENMNNKIKNKDNIIEIIQNSINKINANKNSKNFKDSLIENTGNISEKLNELENILKEIENDMKLKTYDNKKEEIIKDLDKIESEIIDYKKKSENLRNIIIEESENDFKKIDKNFFKASKLMISKRNPNEIYQSKFLFSENNKKEKINKIGLLYKDWNEKCFIYNDYDIHEINFELKAVGLPPRICLNNCSIGLNLESSIEILELQLDGIETKSEYKNYTIRFNINLGNGQSNKVYLKYKEEPLINGISKGEKKERNFNRYKFYGLKHYLQNQIAKFTLLNKSDFKIISFDNIFLAKSNDNEYTWGGEVPKEGKRTMVRMSKPEGNFIFEIIAKLENINKTSIENEKLFVPYFFEGGNNTISNIVFSSQPKKEIIKNDKLKRYEVNFINIQENTAIFSLKCEFKNKCKGEWKCNLSDEEIDAEIPEDFKQNKKLFQTTAKNIIENYNKEHEGDLIEVTDMFKIGNWVKNNVKYNKNYLKRYEITAIETLKNKIGVSHHITQLYNALMYSLGYKCIYISGYFINKTNIYNDNDSHSWSLIKINDNWLPFDPTCGIFTGEFPVSHVFKSFFMKKVIKEGLDSVKIGETNTHGKFVDLKN